MGFRYGTVLYGSHLYSQAPDLWNKMACNNDGWKRTTALTPVSPWVPVPPPARPINAPWTRVVTT